MKINRFLFMLRSSQSFATVLLVVSLAGHLGFEACFLQAPAAKKYYPPGYKPVSDNLLLPTENPPEPKAPATKIQYTTQTIVRTVPVLVKPKPKDPLTVYMEEQRFSEALGLINQRLQKTPQNLVLRLTRAEVYYQKQNFEEAKTEYQRVINRSKDKTVQAKAYSGLGMVQLYQSLQKKRLGDASTAAVLLKQADLSFQQALKLDAKAQQAWVGLAQIALSENNLAEAEAAVKAALKLSPIESSLLLTQGQLLLAQGKPNEALPLIFKAKQKAPREPKVNLLLGQAYLTMARYDDAIIQLQQLLEKVPDHSEALIMLSTAYDNKKKPDDAEIALEKAVTLNPSDVEAAMSLLKTYDQHGEKEESILLLKTLLKEQPNLVTYQHELLKRLLQQDEWEEAYELGAGYVEALSLPPKPEEAESVNQLLGRFAKAAHLKSKGLISRHSFLTNPTLQKVARFYTQKLQTEPDNLDVRLTLLLLDPLAPLPPLTKNFVLNEEALVTGMKIAFLQGNWDVHRALLQRRLSADWAEQEALSAAHELMQLGDYYAAMLITDWMAKNHPDSEKAMALAKRIASTQRKAQTQIQGLQMLPDKIPISYWKSTAEEALRLSSGNWQLHAWLADFLLSQKAYSLALVQQRMAAQYAPSMAEKNRWMKKFMKTQQKYGRV